MLEKHIPSEPGANQAGKTSLALEQSVALHASNLADILRARLMAMFAWVERNGFEGWDPYDLWDSPLGLRLMGRGSLGARVGGRLLTAAQDVAPILCREVLACRPAVNAKGVALVVQAAIESTAQLESLERYRELEDHGVTWLHQNAAQVGSGVGWGYPFDWQTRIRIPRGTPTVVTSTTVGNTMRAHWLRRGNVRSRELAHLVAVFIRESLIRRTGRSHWIAYTPLDDFQVHNASLMGAAYLAQDAVDREDPGALREAVEIAHFSLRDMRPDGTLNYWGTLQAGNRPQQDTYHSGFEIRALLKLAALTGRAEFTEAARRYADVWLDDFVPADGKVAHARGVYRVTEVHSVAEAILTLAALNRERVLSSTDFVRRLKAVLGESAQRLWRQQGANTGYYAWKARKGWFGDRVTDIPLIRWGVGWMLLAHSCALQQVTSISREARHEP